MEGREGLSSEGGGCGGGGGVTVVSSDAPSDNQVAPGTVTSPELNGQVGMLPAPATEGLVMTVKKRRGRPRKYRPGETAVISPKPISSAAPLPPVIDFSATKRAKFLPFGSWSNLQSSISGELVACSAGGNFTPHIITVNAGEVTWCCYNLVP
ncbi:unnamed protein product [Rhodiola kirilowii]